MPSNDVRVTSCSAVFGPKKGFAGRAVRPKALKIPKNAQDIRGVELLGLQNYYLEILNLLEFRPSQKINIFAKKSKVFRFAKKNGIDVIAPTNF